MKLVEVFSRAPESWQPVERPYIVAEVGVNHEGSMQIAERLVIDAKEGGAHAVKFQTYKAETLASRDSPAYWDLSKEPTDSQFGLFKKHDSFWKGEFEQLKTICDREGIEFLSTPFDVESAHFLNDLMDAFKISSSDITNRPFIEMICSFQKPIILSTGASSLAEIQSAVSWIETSRNPLALLHCVLNYPTPDDNAHLGMIFGLKQAFPDKVIGYSDHTLPKDMASLEIATLFGARVLEKHFTHDKTLPGNDHYHAMDKTDLVFFCERLEQLFTRIGRFDVASTPEQMPARRNARRSLVAKRDIPLGKAIDAEDLTWKRPAHGVSPKDYYDVLGKRAKTAIAEDSLIQWDQLD